MPTIITKEKQLKAVEQLEGLLSTETIDRLKNEIEAQPETKTITVTDTNGGLIADFDLVNSNSIIADGFHVLINGSPIN